MAAGTKSNVIDITKRLKQKSQETSKPAKSIKYKNQIVDMTSRRKEMIQSERRHVRRTVLSQFIGAFVVHATKGLESVAIFDISENGLSFDLPFESGRFREGEDITLRIYLSHDLYFSFQVKISNVRPGDGTYRHGVIFEAEQAASSTLANFVKFLESVATIAKRDQGERLVGKAD